MTSSISTQKWIGEKSNDNFTDIYTKTITTANFGQQNFRGLQVLSNLKEKSLPLQDRNIQFEKKRNTVYLHMLLYSTTSHLSK